MRIHPMPGRRPGSVAAFARRHVGRGFVNGVLVCRGHAAMVAYLPGVGRRGRVIRQSRLSRGWSTANGPASGHRSVDRQHDD